MFHKRTHLNELESLLLYKGKYKAIKHFSSNWENQPPPPNLPLETTKQNSCTCTSIANIVVSLGIILIETQKKILQMQIDINYKISHR